jgi:hypothetical protein
MNRITLSPGSALVMVSLSLARIASRLAAASSRSDYTQCGENPDPAPIAFNLTVEPGAPVTYLYKH